MAKTKTGGQIPPHARETRWLAMQPTGETWDPNLQSQPGGGEWDPNSAALSPSMSDLSNPSGNYGGKPVAPTKAVGKNSPPKSDKSPKRAVKQPAKGPRRAPAKSTPKSGPWY